MKEDDCIPARRAQNGCLSLLTWNCKRSPYDAACGQSVSRWSLLKHTRECVNNRENTEEFSEGQYRVVQWNKHTNGTRRGAFDSREKRLLASWSPSLRLTAGNGAAPTGWISAIFGTGGIYKNLSRYYKFF